MQLGIQNWSAARRRRRIAQEAFIWVEGWGAGFLGPHGSRYIERETRRNRSLKTVQERADWHGGAEAHSKRGERGGAVCANKDRHHAPLASQAAARRALLSLQELRGGRNVHRKRTQNGVGVREHWTGTLVLDRSY